MLCRWPWWTGEQQPWLQQLSLSEDMHSCEQWPVREVLPPSMLMPGDQGPAASAGGLPAAQQTLATDTRSSPFPAFESMCDKGWTILLTTQPSRHGFCRGPGGSAPRQQAGSSLPALQLPGPPAGQLHPQPQPVRGAAFVPLQPGCHLRRSPAWPARCQLPCWLWHG